MGSLKILIIEDNATIAAQTGEFLCGLMWQVDFAADAALGAHLARTEIYDVILLDLNLPDQDGLDLCQTIKREAERTPPILMVTARDSFEDKAAGFNRGADDYLTKPFDLRELALRCQALARRQSLHQPKVWEVGSLRLNARTQQAWRESTLLNLTHTGFKILDALAQAYPEPVSRSVLSHHLWGDSPPETDALKSHVYALRQALDKPFAHPMLKTILNVGYKLEGLDDFDT
ncbi:response regulator transcription factor [Gilvimarinus sp. SDUM040013]|uniref:Response regulator transcription factor n=1 Tax=Gilvimarinus gilvus TaxID=3058038 RepID=A0ABU4S4E6_9GAMM|nr:response regulator transcription factor [Gilvimarinus sp. SDUM040013]MDO3384910.1 response regulator transcription factor [Gilvimarinus sp. SDUM040013]MDX6851451.1 response regulator transcription factor [Gilvimarinus sp. SDUM040013]